MKNISVDLARNLLYKFLRRENLLYEYAFETVKQRNLWYNIEKKTMREKMEIIMNDIVYTYCQFPNISPPQIKTLFTNCHASFSWCDSERGFEFWCDKANEWFVFLAKHFNIDMSSLEEIRIQ